MRLQGKTALVTGGAGAIGRAVALRLASEGAAVAVADLNLDQAEKVAGELQLAGAQAMAVQVDVRDRASVRQMATAVLGRFIAVDILVSNAGGSAREENAPFHRSKDEVVDRILDVNLKGPIFCIRALVEHMVERGGGKIINIGSIVGIQGSRNLADYSAAKGGIIAFTKTLAMELGEHGINVNCVSPGLVPRPGTEVSHVPATNYLGKICRPEDVANLVVFLTTEEACFITGQNYVIDGGRSLGLKSK